MRLKSPKFRLDKDRSLFLRFPIFDERHNYKFYFVSF